MPNARHAYHKTGILSGSDTAGPLVLALEVSFNSGISDSKSGLLRSFRRIPQNFMPVEKHLGVSCEAVTKAEVCICELEFGTDSPPSGGKSDDRLVPVSGVVESLVRTQT